MNKKELEQMNEYKELIKKKSYKDKLKALKKVGLDTDMASCNGELNLYLDGFVDNYDDIVDLGIELGILKEDK